MTGVVNGWGVGVGQGALGLLVTDAEVRVVRGYQQTLFVHLLQESVRTQGVVVLQSLVGGLEVLGGAVGGEGVGQDLLEEPVRFQGPLVVDRLLHLVPVVIAQTVI